MTEVHVRGAHAVVRAEGLEDEVAVEEPLEIRVDGRALAVTMRTPGHDEELALGFLYGEGLIDEPREAGPPADLAGNTVEVAGPLLREPSARSFFTSSSCGVCGKGALEEVAVHAEPAARTARCWSARCWPICPSACASRRSPAPAGCTPPACSPPTASCCACARTSAATTRWTRSIGWALREGLVPLHPRLLCVSGRLSFELVQKAAVAGAPVLVGVGAPTSLAVRLAEDRGLTLCGFARGGRVNVYTGEERVG